MGVRAKDSQSCARHDTQQDYFHKWYSIINVCFDCHVCEDTAVLQRAFSASECAPHLLNAKVRLLRPPQVDLVIKL